MTHSPLTNEIRLSPQHSPRNGARIDTFLIHHGATVSEDGTSLVNVLVGTAREVSANYAIGSNGKLWCVVDEDRRAWTSGSSSDDGKGAAWDRRSITVEIANEDGAPNWPIRQAAIDTAAHLLNDLRARYGIVNVLGHRDLWTNYRASYATFCPGPDTVARIVARAAELQNPEAVAAEKDAVRKVARYLNSLDLPPRLGLTNFDSGAANDGIPLDPGDTYSKFWHLVQMWGRIYRPDVYTTVNDIDGIVGPTTRLVEGIIRPLVLAGTAPEQTTDLPAPVPAPEPEPIPEPEPVEPEPEPEPEPVPEPEPTPEPVEPDPQPTPSKGGGIGLLIGAIIAAVTLVGTWLLGWLQ